MRTKPPLFRASSSPLTTGEARKKTHSDRKDSLKQREEIQRLREALEDEQWSDDLEDRVVELRQNLVALLLELCSSNVNTLVQQEQIADSREQEDRVSLDVWSAENGATHQERRLLLDETEQTVKELELGEREAEKRKKGRRRQRDDERK